MGTSAWLKIQQTRKKKKSGDAGLRLSHKPVMTSQDFKVSAGAYVLLYRYKLLTFYSDEARECSADRIERKKKHSSDSTTLCMFCSELRRN